jgi:GNAT superfamily N-acetyltransferase
MEIREPVFDRWPSHLEGNIDIKRDFDVTVESYRKLYNEIGEQWLWGDRRKLSDGDLAAIIYDPKVEVYLLVVDGETAGYLELDFRSENQVELAYCGLRPKFLGQHLAGALLRHGITQAFRNDPERVWLHTCTQDHPNAINVYEHMGFTVYDQEDTLIDDPRALGLIPKHVAQDRFPVAE